MGLHAWRTACPCTCCALRMHALAAACCCARLAHSARWHAHVHADDARVAKGPGAHARVLPSLSRGRTSKSPDRKSPLGGPRLTSAHTPEPGTAALAAAAAGAAAAAAGAAAGGGAAAVAGAGAGVPGMGGPQPPADTLHFGRPMGSPLQQLSVGVTGSRREGRSPVRSAGNPVTGPQ